MLTEDYVSFEIAKLLKEKGFDVYVRSFYDADDMPVHHNEALWDWNLNKENYRFSAPTLQMAMKWLREVHNLCILVEFSTFEFNKERPFMWSIRYQKVDGDYIGGTYHHTYEEACESGIRYCLENLI